MKPCPFCQGEMVKEPNVIPSWFSPFQVLKDARPRLFGWLENRLTGEAYEKGTETVDKYLDLWRCKKCGFYALFDPDR